MSYHPTPAAVAACDQDTAEVRDLVQLVHKHRTDDGCTDPGCPGITCALVLGLYPPGRWLLLLAAALIRVDDLQTGIADAIDAIAPPPLDHPWHP